MANAVMMPKQGQSVESCLITKWHKSVGDNVKTGEILFSYETDKAAFDKESEADGVLLAIFANEGDDVPCLNNVGVIGQKGEDFSMFAGASGETKEEPKAVTAEANKEEVNIQKTEAVNAPSVQSDKTFISPRARKTAERLGVDMFSAKPTGANGRIMERDIYNITEQKASAPKQALPEKPAAEGTGEYADTKLSNVRKVIARAMHDSISSMAQLTHNSSFDATDILEFRKRLKSAENTKDITLNDMILFAVSRALKKHANMNAHFLGDSMRVFKSVNLGIAVDTERGLLVPTLFNADSKSLSEISKEAKELAAAAKTGRIAPELLSGGTFTVTNLGSLGVESFTPVINPPQVAILGVCAIQTRIRETEGKITTYPAMVLSLTYDHRAVDGAPSARFAKELGEMLENFHALLAE
jgi:pyruvate dehydrogenase E2 component (dihydrolipoamide acetyltransferase)